MAGKYVCGCRGCKSGTHDAQGKCLSDSSANAYAWRRGAVPKEVDAGEGVQRDWCPACWNAQQRGG
jgi:hypothetical protein